jgi:hypothetical protein
MHSVSMRINCGVMLALMALPSCSPSRTILGFGDETAGEQDQTDSDTGEEESGSSSESGSSTDDDGTLLDLGEPDPNYSCTNVGTLAHPRITEYAGPAHHDGNLYWGEWGTNAYDDPETSQTWRWQTLEPEMYDILDSSIDSTPAHSVVVDGHYLYTSGLDHNPIRLPVGGGDAEPIPAPLGYAESSSELLLSAYELYWLNHSMDEITLMRTQLGSLSTEVLVDGPLGEQLAGNEQTGLFVLRPAGASTDVLRVDPSSGTSEELINLPATSANVGELLAVDDELYVVYTSADTAQIDRVTLEGTATTIVEPGSYTLITHPVVFHEQLYFEFADPEFAWGRVGLDDGVVEALGPEADWNPQRWQPILALEHCLVVLISFPGAGSHTVKFSLYGFAD